MVSGFGGLPFDTIFHFRGSIGRRIWSPHSTHVSYHSGEVTGAMGDGSHMVINHSIDDAIPSVPIDYLLARFVGIVDFRVIWNGVTVRSRDSTGLSFILV